MENNLNQNPTHNQIKMDKYRDIGKQKGVKIEGK